MPPRVRSSTFFPDRTDGTLIVTVAGLALMFMSEMIWLPFAQMRRSTMTCREPDTSTSGARPK